MGPYAAAGSWAHPPGLPFHLLEVTIISAQDLPHPAASRPTYAVAWTDPSDSVVTAPSPCGGGPHHAWNEKLVFGVDDAFLRSETAAVTVQLYAIRGRLTGCVLSDQMLGTVRVVVSAVRLSTSTRFVALQVRRPKTLYPHGILTLGITLIPSRSLYFGHSVSGSPALYATTAHGAVMTYGEIRRNALAAQGEREREILESKLRKWRSDLSPVHNQGESLRSTGDQEDKKGETSQGLGEEVKEDAKGETPRRSSGAGEVKEGTTRSQVIVMRRRRRGMFSCFHGGK